MRSTTALLFAAAASVAGGVATVAEPIPEGPRIAEIRAAQARIQPIILAANQQSPDGADVSVYVPDSSKALEQFRLAERLESQREWGKAAEVYQEIVSDLGDRVIPAPPEASEALPGDGAPRGPQQAAGMPRYETVARQVERRLAAWPAEGQRAFLVRFEPPAADALALAGNDPAELARVIERYYITAASLEAALRLIDLRLTSGDLPGAVALTRRLLATHPLAAVGSRADDTLSGRAGLLFRAAVASAWAGDAGGSRAALDELGRQYPQSQGTVAGKSVNLGTEAARLVADAARNASAQTHSPQQSAGASWRTPGGDFSRDRISDAKARPAARVTTLVLPEVAPPRAGRSLPAAILQQQSEQLTTARRDGALSVMLPSADRGELFFQDGSRLWGVSLESGLPLPGWAMTYPASGAGLAGVYTIPRPLSPTANHQYSVTLTDDSVLAVMGYADTRSLQFTGGIPSPSSPRLVRLERSTGRQVWEFSPRQAGDADEGIRSFEFSGSPVVVGDSVLIAARGTKGNQFDDAYVLCFDYGTGRLKWNTYIASSAGALRAFIDGTLGTQTVTHLAASAGRVFFQTNLGALASVDTATGRPEWISLYRRNVVTDNMRSRVWNARLAMLSGATRPWAYNPPIVSGSLLFSLPTDSGEVQVVDTTTGRIVRSIPTAEFDNADVLIHADNERLLLASSTAVFAIDWRKVEPGKADAEGPLLWRSDLAGSPLRGRPFLTRSSLFVPTAARLIEIDPVGGKTLSATPDFKRTWEPGEGQGNVIAADDHLVIAGAGRVEIFTDLDLAEKRYQAEIQRLPTDPAPRLRWAEVMFNAGRIDQAVALLGEASDLIDKSPADASAGSARLFATAMSLADAVARQPAAGGLAAPDRSRAVAAFFDRAARSARTPAQHVDYRRRRAETFASVGELPAALALWQEVLAEPAWRGVRVADETTGSPIEAARLARREVQAIITRAPSTYTEYDRQASQLLAAASEVVQLLSVAERFPNSAAAPEALLGAAEKLAATDPRGTARVLRDLFVGYPGFPRRAFVAEAMARAYAAVPGRGEVALSRLAMGARLYPDHTLTRPLLSPEGKPLVPASPESPLGFAAAAEKLRASLASDAGRLLPDFRLPGNDQTTRFRRQNNAKIEPVLTDASAAVPNVLSVLPALPGASRTDRVVVQRPGSELAVIEPGKGVLWSARSPGPLARGTAFLGDTMLAWDNNAIAGYSLDPASQGQLLFRFDTAGLPPLDVSRGLFEGEDPGDPNAQVQIIQNGERRIVLRPGFPARIMMPGANLNAIAGVNERQNGEQIAQVALAGERVLIATASGRLVCLSPTTGAILWQSRPTPTAPTRLVANEDFAVVISADEGSSSISALDAESGTVTWRRTSSDVTRQPLAAAISPDGMLIYTLVDRLCAKDLFDPGEALTFETSPNPTAPFANFDRPDQIAITEGLFLAVTDQGQFVRAFVIADQLKPLLYPARDARSEPVQALFPTLARITNQQPDPTATIRVDGPLVYVRSPKSIVAYDLRAGRTLWKQTTETTPHQFGTLELSPDFVLAISPLAPQQGPVTEPRLFAISRESTGESGQESGRRLHEFSLPSKSMVKQVVPTDGGILYLTIDSVLHFARGTAEEEKAP